MMSELPNEATVTINGRELSGAQAMALRVAVSNMLMELSDGEWIAGLGPISPLYQARLREIEAMLIVNSIPTTTR